MNDDDLLYHYTSAEGLIGLLGQPYRPASMWLTQIQYMNDDAEFYHAFEIARASIQRLDQSGLCTGVRRVAAGSMGVPHLTYGSWHDPIKGTVMHNHYSFSLSEKPDLLSQWRGYTPEGGYCVGFRVKALREFALTQGLSLVRCVYDDVLKQSEIESEILKIEEGLQRGEIDMSIGNIDAVPELERVEATARYRVNTAASSRAPYFKQSSFEEECEWRLVGLIGATDPRARWRSRGNVIVPYSEILIGKGALSELLVEEVVVGPGLDFEHARYAIQFMNFARLGMPVVKASGSSLRR